MAYSKLPGEPGAVVLPVQARPFIQSGSVDIFAFGARGKKETSTGDMTAGSAVLSNVAASKFPEGTWVAVDGAGAASTTGSMTNASYTLTVANAAGFEIGKDAQVTGAGPGGADLYGEITQVVNTTITLARAASATVTGVAVALVESTSLPARLIGKVITAGGSTLILDRAATTSVTGATVTTDNSLAIQAAIDSMNAPVSLPGGTYAMRSGKTLYIPPGELDEATGYSAYPCHRTIRITRQMLVTGDVPTGMLGGAPTARLELARGMRTGMLVESVVDSRTTGGYAHGATVQNLVFSGNCVFEQPSGIINNIFNQPYPAPRNPKTAYAKGDVRLPSVAR